MKSLLTWCVENNRQDIIKSYVLTNIYTMQDISYGLKNLHIGIAINVKLFIHKQYKIKLFKIKIVQYVAIED